MPEAFISYSTQDSAIARELHTHLTGQGIETFLAEVSLEAGKRWKETIIESLNQSKWVFLLATPDACKSDAVKHEIGAVLSRKKELITLMYGTTPADLPAWIRDTQAIDIHDKARVESTIQKIAGQAKADRDAAALVVVGVVAFIGFLLLGNKKG